MVPPSQGTQWREEMFMNFNSEKEDQTKTEDADTADGEHPGGSGVAGLGQLSNRSGSRPGFIGTRGIGGIVGIAAHTKIAGEAGLTINVGAAGAVTEIGSAGQI